MNAQISDLIQSARHGSEQSLGKLLDRYRNYLKLLATTKLAGRVRARAGSSDVVQEVCLQACRSFPQFRGNTEGELLAWLRAVLASRLNRLLDQHLGAERRDVRREVSLNAIANSLDRSSIRLDELAADSRLSPSGELHASERVRALADQIAELPPDYRQVILLRNFEGLPFAEVAICVDRSQGATRMLWLRAVEMLRKRLTSKGLV